MQNQRTLTPVVRTLLYSLLLICGLPTAYAQHVPSAFSLNSVPADGLVLKEGWRFQPGDKPNGASPELDDSQWSSIDPTKSMHELPQLQQAGVNWLRLHLHTGPELPLLMVDVFQLVASELYLDGKLLYRFGTVSTNPDSVLAYNPYAAFNFPLRASSDHVLAIRFAHQSGLDDSKKNFNWRSTAVKLTLFPATDLPAIQPNSLQATLLDTLKVGVSFILFILHLSLFFAYRRQWANLYAAALYLLSIITFLSKASVVFSHSMSQRATIYYGSVIDWWVPCLVVLTYYQLFGFKKGWLFWLSIASVGLRFVPLIAEYQLANFVVSYFLPVELVRLSLVALRRRLLGAHIITIGSIVNLGLTIAFAVLPYVYFPFMDSEWFGHTMYFAAFLCTPLTLSLRLALEHGFVNRQLKVQLQEVESLSARNLAQQEERQQLLAEQNEQLEQQVTERTQELRQQADQLRELDQVKSRFVTNITHEFRTPLSLIISPVEKLLEESRFDRSVLTLVHRNAGQLLRLINQLLDLSKLESNHMPISLMQGNVADFIHYNAELFRRAAAQKSVTLTCVADALPQQSQVFDADKWEKILSNLLSNALTFTPADGQVTLTVTPVWAGGEMAGVELELVDSGIGIAPDKLPHIFDRFYQVDTSATRAYEGTGIGLALVHELISLLGGTITVTSQLSLGTTFRLTLPVGSVSTVVDAVPVNWSAPETNGVALLPLPTPVPASSEQHPHPVPRILIVEDNDELREFLVGELAGSYQVLEAVDGEAGWEVVQNELPDIVLTDVMMPRMDGTALTRLIKGHAETDHIAVVMLTAKTARQSRLDGLQQGADDYLSKPFSVNELHLRLHNLITRQQKLADHYRQVFALPDQLPIAPVARPLASQDPFLGRIYALLDGHLDDPSISVDWLADQLAMSRKTLYRKVHSLLQLAPADLMRQYRLRKAADLLGAGHSVAETADLVGFKTPSHFSLVFNEFYRQTPTKFIASRSNSDRS